jgi:hypothetical protein
MFTEDESPAAVDTGDRPSVDTPLGLAPDQARRWRRVISEVDAVADKHGFTTYEDMMVLFARIATRSAPARAGMLMASETHRSLNQARFGRADGHPRGDNGNMSREEGRGSFHQPGCGAGCGGCPASEETLPILHSNQLRDPQQAFVHERGQCGFKLGAQARRFRFFEVSQRLIAEGRAHESHLLLDFSRQHLDDAVDVSEGERRGGLLGNTRQLPRRCGGGVLLTGPITSQSDCVSELDLRRTS